MFLNFYLFPKTKKTPKKPKQELFNLRLFIFLSPPENHKTSFSLSPSCTLKWLKATNHLMKKQKKGIKCNVPIKPFIQLPGNSRAPDKTPSGFQDGYGHRKTPITDKCRGGYSGWTTFSISNQSGSLDWSYKPSCELHFGTSSWRLCLDCKTQQESAKTFLWLKNHTLTALEFSDQPPEHKALPQPPVFGRSAVLQSIWSFNAEWIRIIYTKKPKQIAKPPSGPSGSIFGCTSIFRACTGATRASIVRRKISPLIA